MHHVTSSASWFPSLRTSKMPRENCLKVSKKRQVQLRLARLKITNKKETAGKQSSKTNYEMPSQSASMRKLSLGKQEEGVWDLRTTQQWLMVHVERLNNLIAEVICLNCAGTGFKMYIDPQNQGCCSILKLKCSLCERDGYRKIIFTSPQLPRRLQEFDVNVRMMLLAHELGLGYAAHKKINSVGNPWASP